MKKRILIVEDSTMVLKVIKHVVKTSRLIDPVYAESFAEAKAHIDSDKEGFFAVLVDLNLPDAPDGEVVDYALQNKLPTIVLTGSFDTERRKHLIEKGVVDYITKEGRFSYEYAVRLVERLAKNEHVNVLVVDDSKVGRKAICKLLRLQRFNVFEAEDGVQGIKTLLENPSIKLVITDFNMPRMDGCTMVQNLRGKYEKSDLTIIGLSSEGEEALSARFIKSGANDFLRKPFNQEEFFCRVTHNVDLLEMVETLRDARHRDFLTGAYNHQYFFQHGQDLVARARAQQVPVSAAVIELDAFKAISAEFGHEVVDEVMQSAVSTLMSAFERFLFACAGGQQFYVLMVGLDAEKAVAFIDKVRQLMGAQAIACQDKSVTLTVSAGVASCADNDLDSSIKSANELLIRAQEAGGDFVIGDEDESE